MRRDRNRRNEKRGVFVFATDRSGKKLKWYTKRAVRWFGTFRPFKLNKSIVAGQNRR